MRMAAAADSCQHHYVKIPARCLHHSQAVPATQHRSCMYEQRRLSQAVQQVCFLSAAPPQSVNMMRSTRLAVTYELTQGLVSERDKAFRAQAFALKQANTHVAQLQQQQADSTSREAALMEELSFGAIQGQPSAADSLLSAGDHGVTGLRKVQSRLPSGMETMRRRLEPIISTGLPSVLTSICPLCSWEGLLPGHRNQKKCTILPMRSSRPDVRGQISEVRCCTAIATLQQ